MDESTRTGVVEILLSRRAVSVDGHLVKIGSRAFELLVAFAQRPGQLVTKAALIDAAWGHDDVGDFNLHVQIAALRKQFGKAAIVTIPGRGYSCSLSDIDELDDVQVTFAVPRAGNGRVCRPLAPVCRAAPRGAIRML